MADPVVKAPAGVESVTEEVVAVLTPEAGAAAPATEEVVSTIETPVAEAVTEAAPAATEAAPAAETSTPAVDEPAAAAPAADAAPTTEAATPATEAAVAPTEAAAAATEAAAAATEEAAAAPADAAAPAAAAAAAATAVAAVATTATAAAAKAEPKAAPAPKKVVIVGGGFAGAYSAKGLEDVADVTLIDSKDFFEITWAGLRALVEPAISNKVFFPHSWYLKKAKVVVGTVTSATDKEVTVGEGESAQTFPFDFLIIASGSVPQPPAAVADKISRVQAENEKLKAATNVLIVGGGPTGVELAAEIATDFPDKKVTLVHGGSRLMEVFGEKASVKALKWLEANKVTVLLNDKVDVTFDQWGTSGTFTTTGGKEIPTDYLAPTLGRKANATWLEGTFGSVIEKSAVKVDSNLHVEGYTNIFAIGDVANLTPKQGYLACAQAKLVETNIKLMIKAGEKGVAAKSLKKYPTPGDMAIISLGRKNGIMQAPFGTFMGFIPTTFKSKGLFIAKVWKELKVVKA